MSTTQHKSVAVVDKGTPYALPSPLRILVPPPLPSSLNPLSSHHHGNIVIHDTALPLHPAFFPLPRGTKISVQDIFIHDTALPLHPAFFPLPRRTKISVQDIFMRFRNNFCSIRSITELDRSPHTLSPPTFFPPIDGVFSPFRSTYIGVCPTPTSPCAALPILLPRHDERYGLY